METKLTLRQLAKKARHTFSVPSFQRRYVWGQPRPGTDDSVSLLVKHLLQACCDGTDYFIQGITCARTKANGKHAYSLVDGQQRITCLLLLIHYLMRREGKDEPLPFNIAYECRPKAETWLCNLANGEISTDTDTQDTYYFARTLDIIDNVLASDTMLTADYVLDHVNLLCIMLDEDEDTVFSFKMMNGTKAAMKASDVIKADMIRLASDPAQPNATASGMLALRSRYASEWESWVSWWCRADVRKYYSDCGSEPLSLLLKLCLRQPARGSSNPQAVPLGAPVAHDEFRHAIECMGIPSYHAAKHFFHRLRRIQKGIEEAYDQAATYNMIRAILLLQDAESRFDFLHAYFVECSIDEQELARYYRLSFLGMSIAEIRDDYSSWARFDELMASLSMADVYHTEAKRDAFNLLLRLNIDEDIKLGRKFDFSIWQNRSLEHIYSKSKVWHQDPGGKILDGNDNPIRASRREITADRTFIPRDSITGRNGLKLSEHCIGNLVLLYGQNNASFGNASFEQKKLMFLTPGSMDVFQSRNLLHSVCVFAGNSWSARSIVDNYYLTLHNLQLYYGYK